MTTTTVTRQVERRPTKGAVETRSGGSGRRIGGHAAVFGKSSENLGGFYERVHPKAFNKSQADGWPGAVARWNHRDEYLLGTTAAGTLQLAIDGHGLQYVVDLPECRNDVHELVSRGDVASSSFAFQTYQDDWGTTEGGYPMRTLVSCRLIDVAPVTNPAYPDATVGLRSLATFVGAPVEDVVDLAKQGELRKLFVRTDAPAQNYAPHPMVETAGAETRSLHPSDARVQLLLTRYGGPPPVQRDPIELLDQLHRNRWPSYEVTPISQQRSL